MRRHNKNNNDGGNGGSIPGCSEQKATGQCVLERYLSATMQGILYFLIFALKHRLNEAVLTFTHSKI